jgi:multidrug efflux pump subunit AcrB
MQDARKCSSVPILQLGLSGRGLSEQELNDLALNFLRTQLITVPGAVVPLPYGGKQRQVMVNLDPYRMQAKGISPTDVLNAVNAQNLVLPSGTAKVAESELDVRMNTSPRTVGELNDLPIKQVNHTTIYLRDVARVSDGFAIQTNVVRQDGQRGVLLSILKARNASTLDVVAGIKTLLPRVASTLPPELKITPLADQSIFRAQRDSRRRPRSPDCRRPDRGDDTSLHRKLAQHNHYRDLYSVVDSHFRNRSELSGRDDQRYDPGRVGILVDDATVEIENINRILEEGHETDMKQAILDGAKQIAVPALVSALCICIVFMPLFLLSGVARYLPAFFYEHHHSSESFS